VIVLDASALLAFLFKEQGGDQVATRIGSSCLSAVNLAQVIGKFVDNGVSADVVLGKILASTIEVVPFAPTDAALAASLRPQTQRHGLSLADRACLALAIERGLPVFTADRAWAALDIAVKVTVVR
jgi:PIN domain nuclease of toxin-antitoxin system